MSSNVVLRTNDLRACDVAASLSVARDALVRAIEVAGASEDGSAAYPSPEALARALSVIRLIEESCLFELHGYRLVQVDRPT
jgi:hypothetical protein